VAQLRKCRTIFSNVGLVQCIKYLHPRWGAMTLHSPSKWLVGSRFVHLSTAGKWCGRLATSYTRASGLVTAVGVGSSEKYIRVRGGPDGDDGIHRSLPKAHITSTMRVCQQRDEPFASELTLLLQITASHWDGEAPGRDWAEPSAPNGTPQRYSEAHSSSPNPSPTGPRAVGRIRVPHYAIVPASAADT
jgi:hypothetical protein